MEQKDKAEFKRIQREWRQELNERLRQIEAELEALGDNDLAMDVDNIRSELSVKLIKIGEEQ